VLKSAAHFSALPRALAAARRLARLEERGTACAVLKVGQRVAGGACICGRGCGIFRPQLHGERTAGRGGRLL